MNRTMIFPEATEQALPLGAVVLYDQHASGLRAKLFLDHVAATAGLGIEFRLALWRIDSLADADTSLRVFQSLECSPILALALRAGRELPKSIFGWVECWAHCRSEDDSALVVLGIPGPATLKALNKTAERGGITLFCEDGMPAAVGWQNHLDDTPKRGQTARPRMNIPDDWRSEPYNHWGINE